MPGEIDRVFYHHGGDLSGSVEIRFVTASPRFPQMDFVKTVRIWRPVDGDEAVRELASRASAVTRPAAY